MITIACPHQEIGYGNSSCPGCGPIDSEFWNCGEGEITGHVYRDTEGDAGVIGDLEATCSCILTDSEWDKVRETLCEQGSEPSDPAG